MNDHPQLIEEDTTTQAEQTALAKSSPSGLAELGFQPTFFSLPLTIGLSPIKPQEGLQISEPLFSSLQMGK